MGLFDWLVGGKTKVKSSQKLSPEAQALMEGVVPIAQQFLNKDLEIYPGSRVQGTTRNEAIGQRSLVKAAGREIPRLSALGGGYVRDLLGRGGTGAGVGLAQSAQSIEQLQGAGGAGAAGLGSILANYNNQAGGRNFLSSGAALDPSSNPAIQAMMDASTRNIREGLMEKALPAVRSDFISGNSFGGSRQGVAEGQAIRGAEDAAALANANILNNAYNTGLGAMTGVINAGTGAASSGVGSGLGAGQSAGGLGTALYGQGLAGQNSGLGQLPGMAQLALTPGLVQNAVGQAQHQQAQTELSDTVDKFNTQQLLRFLQAQQVANMASSLGGGSSTTTSSKSGIFG